MISIDGLNPDAVLHADKHGLRIPVLRSFLENGSYAQDVVNVNPTVTNPNHTTLVTGVLPSEHGIYNNRPFAPTAKLPASYGDYAQIKAPTLWGAAKAAGLTTASIFWPVTRNAKDIDFNILTGSDEDEHKIGDDAVALIAQHHPDLLTVHFVSFDHRQHEAGPDSAAGNAALERIDTAIGRIVMAERKANPDSVVLVVSDHGFFKVTHQVNLNAALVRAGFITLDGAAASVTAWNAFAWYVGGSAMIVLRDPGDHKTRNRVKACLDGLAAEPANGIEKVYSRDELASGGTAPNAALVVALAPGYRMGNAMTGPLVAAATGGAHGAVTSETLRPEMHSAFFIEGSGIAAKRNLGMIGMRQVAPTVAEILGVPLASADASAIPTGGR